MHHQESVVHANNVLVL